MRSVARPALLPALALLLASQAAARQGEPPPSWDAALRWEGARHATLGPTGRRLFASRIEPVPGMGGRFHYGAASSELTDPIRVQVLRDGRPLELELAGSTWFPSHLEERWRGGGLDLAETELITDGDAVVDELRLTNAGQGALELELHFSGGATPQRERGRSRMVPVDLAGVATVAPAGGTPLFTDRPAPRAVWVEAEAFETVASEGPEASAGRFVRGFAAAAGGRHLLAVTAPPLERPSLLLRYSNAADTAARIAVEVDGSRVGELELDPTEGWSLAAAPLAPLPAGRLLVTLVAEGATPLDLDGLFLAEEGFDPGPLPAAGAYEARVLEQLEFFGGWRELDGVRYALPAAAEVRRPSVVALRGGLDGDRARAFPQRVSLPLPDVRPARSTLHLLMRSEAPRGWGAEGARPATVTLRLDDGSAETLPWPGAPGVARSPGEAPGERVERVPVLLGGLEGPTAQLSYDPPPGRAVARLELAAGDGPQVPLLLAATVEAQSDTGRLPVLVGATTLEAQPVELVLAATDAIAARTPAGERSLLVHVSLAPGETRSLRAVLATGSRRPQCLLQALESAGDADLVARHRATYEAWFSDNVPAFTCSDPWLEQAWRQRWYVVRRNLLRLDLPDFSLATAFEGTCCAQHARVAPRAASFALRELRWLRDPTPAQGTVRALLKRQRPDGLLFPVAPGPPRWDGVYQAHDLAAAAIGVWEVTGSRQYLEEVTELLQRELEAALRHFDPSEDDSLGPFLATDEAATGMFGRPSFELAGHGEPVEPVELGVLLGSSARALARAHGALGNAQESRRLQDLAAQLGAHVERLCWDDETSWFLSLDAGGGAIRVREIAGVLPLATGLVSDARGAVLDTLFSPEGFWARYPVRSVALGDRFTDRPRARSGWDGPVHPEALTWAVDAVARVSRQQRDAGARERLRQVLEAATRLRFEEGALERPIEREAWDPESGDGTGCVDVLRCAYADLLVQCVAGIVPRADGVLELDPLVGGLDHFRFAGLPHRGRRVDVTWDRPDGVRRYDALGLAEGFTVAVDGVPRHQATVLGRVVLD